MADAVDLLFWAAWFSGFSFGIAISLTVALILRAHPRPEETR